MEDGLLGHVMSQIAWGILATAVLYSMADKVEIFLPIYIERWDGPVRLRLLGFLLHVEHTHLCIDLDDACAAQLLYIGLFMAHNA